MINLRERIFELSVIAGTSLLFGGYLTLLSLEKSQKCGPISTVATAALNNSPETGQLLSCAATQLYPKIKDSFIAAGVMIAARIAYLVQEKRRQLAQMQTAAPAA